MTGIEEPTVMASTRAKLAAERARLARASLGTCRLCAHDCGVNRLAGQRGLCHAMDETRAFLAQVEVGNELELIPTFAIGLSGCDMRCAFCITGAESWDPQLGEPFDAVALAAEAASALEAGARTVMILGGEPTVHLPAALEIVAALPNEARLVWKTNAHGGAESRALLDGVFDVWLVDYKFGNDICAARLAQTENYNTVARGNLLWAEAHSELIVRHLLMPGHVDCCWEPIARWISTHLSTTKVSLRSGFWPAWKAGQHSELRRTARATEEKRAVEIARSYGLHLIE